ncbi:MAG: chromosome partition protein MukE [Myxococcota bacterium]
MTPFDRLEDVLLDDLFPELDLALRRGRHVGQEDGPAYSLLLDAAAQLEPFYARYGCELVHRSEGYFYLLPTGDRLGRTHLRALDMVVGQVLALLYLDPAAVQRGGVVHRTEVLGRLDMLVGAEGLARLVRPGQKKFVERVAEETARAKIGESLRALDSLGFVELRDGDLVQLRPALFRFADPVRGHQEVGDALERLVREGEVALEPEAEEEG